MRVITDIRQTLAGGGFDPILRELYCRTAEELQPFRDRVNRLLDHYLRTFGGDESQRVGIYSAPGRTEIGGNHTDHQRGKVLTGAVDLDALACAAPNDTSLIRVFSDGYGLTEINCTELTPVASEKNTTASILRGIAAQVTRAGYPVTGFDAFVTSDVPGGSGLSSSACFEVLIGTLMNDFFCAGALTPVEIAQIGQYAENEYFGKPSGLLDQMGCAIGGAVSIDFRTPGKPDYHAVKFDFSSAGYALCIIDTGADHMELTADYAAIPYEMRSVAKAFGKDVLCEVDETDFYAAVPRLRETIGDRAVMRAVHYYTDCHRVEEQVTALERGDFDRFLRLVSSSGHSSYMYLQNVDTGRNPAYQPVGLALAMAGHYLHGRGARRVHGGGFAGTIQAFVPLDMVPEFRTGMDALLGDGACRVTHIRPVGGCVLA